MAKNKSIFTLQNIIIGVGVGFVISMFLKKKQSTQTNNDTNNQSPLLLDSSGCPIDRYGEVPPAYAINESKILSKKIPAVFEYETVILQRRLNKAKACLKVDGYFEDKTEEAVKKLTGSTSVTLQTLSFFGL